MFRVHVKKTRDTKWLFWILTSFLSHAIFVLLRVVVAVVLRQKFLSDLKIIQTGLERHHYHPFAADKASIYNICLCLQRLHTLLPYVSFWAICNDNLLFLISNFTLGDRDLVRFHPRET